MCGISLQSVRRVKDFHVEATACACCATFIWMSFKSSETCEIGSPQMLAQYDAAGGTWHDVFMTYSA